ncbi:MAG: ribosome silencing factor [Paracoccaceae bacterium]
MARHLKKENTLSQSAHAAHGTAAPKAAKVRLSQPYTSDELLAHILKSLDDDKAEDVVSINLRGKSEIADYMVICSGRSTRQVSAMAEKTTDKLKQEFGVISKTEGKDQGDWVLIDSGDVIVHIFRPEVREFYQLEKMWMSPEQVTTRP